MKCLNLYAGVGGNRKLWEDVSVTAVEYDKKIARVYKDLYPEDAVGVDDAHQFLLENSEDAEFIWSSPPCPSHSRMIRGGRNRKPRYPDMKLYEEIIFLQHNYDGLWVVENVIPYYKPLIEPTAVIGRHMFWSNFPIGHYDAPEFKGFISKQNKQAKQELHDWLGIHYEENLYVGDNHCITQVLRNCVHLLLGRHIFYEALYHMGKIGQKEETLDLFNVDGVQS